MSEPVELPEHISHGSFAAWQRYGCKCGDCRDHWRRTGKRYREARRQFAPEEFEHGLHGYNYYSCRCSICSGARREYDRERLESGRREAVRTPEQVERRREYDRERRKHLTPEQRRQKVEYDRNRRRRMTKAQREREREMERARRARKRGEPS